MVKLRRTINERRIKMNDFEFPDSYDYSEYVEPFEKGVDDVPFHDNIGEDSSEYDGDLTLGEGDYSDVFDPGDEVVDEDGDYSDCE